jgi:hypothetical protein
MITKSPSRGLAVLRRLPAGTLALLLPSLLAAPLRAQDHAGHDHAGMSAIHRFLAFQRSEHRAPGRSL